MLKNTHCPLPSSGCWWIPPTDASSNCSCNTCQTCFKTRFFPQLFATPNLLGGHNHLTTITDNFACHLEINSCNPTNLLHLPTAPSRSSLSGREIPSSDRHTTLGSVSQSVTSRARLYYYVGRSVGAANLIAVRRGGVFFRVRGHESFRVRSIEIANVPLRVERFWKCYLI